jgi:2-oxoglutarate-Fe(II)-dependent dioxygenase family protein
MASGAPAPDAWDVDHPDEVQFTTWTMEHRQRNDKIHDLARHRVDSFTLADPFDAAVVNDEHCMHAVTPVVQFDPARPGLPRCAGDHFQKEIGDRAKWGNDIVWSTPS